MSNSDLQNLEQPPTRRLLRLRIETSFPTRELLNAFCTDYFKETYQKLSPQLPSTELISQLLLQHSEADIERALINATATVALQPSNETSGRNSGQPATLRAVYPFKKKQRLQ